MVLISKNLPLSSYYASSSYNSWLTPSKAFDGDYTGATGYWNSGYYATKWIEVDLGQEYYLDSIKLLTAQGDQSGYTTHEVRVSNQSIGWSAQGASLAKTFNGYTTNNQWLQDNFSNLTTARYVQVRTVSSPSWIAWLEVEVYGDSMVAPTLTDVTVVPSVIYEGDTVSVNLAATDKNPEAISFIVDGKLMGTDANKSGVRSLNNVSLGKYLDEGTYSFTTQAQDSSGRFSNSVVKNFTVLNVAPTITSLTGNITIDYGKPFNFSATAFDPGINDILTYEWDLNGDGLYDNFVGTSGQYLFDAFDKKSSFTVGVKVSDGDGGVTFGSFNVNINPPIPGVLAFNAPTYSITENGTPITQVIVTRTGGSDTEVSGTIALSDGTATVDDYNNTPIKVTFAHGDSTPKIITIPIKEDSQFEAVETIKLSLTNPTNGATIGLQNTAIVKIIDNDNFVFTNTDIKPTKVERLTLPIPTALKQYETLSSSLDKAKVNLGITEEQLTLANDDYLFAKETFEGSLSKQKSLGETLKSLGNKKTALTSSFTQSQTQIQQKLKDIQKSIDDAYGRLKVETNADIKNGIQKEINGYLILIQEQQNLLSVATTRYNQDLANIDFQISESNKDLQNLSSNIIPKQAEVLEAKNQALVAVKTAWEANKQAVTVADKALGDFLTDYAFLKTQDYSSKFLGDTVNSLNARKIHKIREWFNESIHVFKKLGTITAMGATFWMLQGGMAKAATWNLTQTFLNPNPVRQDEFGSSVSKSGNNILIGAYNGALATGGAAYLFDGVTGNLLKTFKDGFGGTFGYSVSIDDNNALIGNDYGAGGGKSSLFGTRTGITSLPLKTFPNPTPANFGRFGISVSISGNNVLIGTATNTATNGPVDDQAAYLFDAVTGNLLKTFLNPTPEFYEYFGESVFISSNNVLIGARADNTGASASGAAYLFDAVTGNLLQTFLNPAPAISDYFGYSLSMSGNKVLIGAVYDNTGANASGGAYLFDAVTGNLLQTFLNPTPAVGDQFGRSVSISGNNVLIGAPNDDTVATDSGAAYLFDAVTGNLIQTILNPTPVIGDGFGTSVFIDANGILVGTPYKNTGALYSGAAYLFQSAQEPPQPPQSVPEGDNVVGLLLFAGGYGFKRVFSQLSKR